MERLVLRLGVGVRSVIFRPHLCVLCAIHTILCCLLVRLLASRCTMYTLYPMFTTARGVPRTVRAAVAGPVFVRVRAAIPLGASACALPRGVSTVRCTPPCCSDNYQGTARWAVDMGDQHCRIHVVDIVPMATRYHRSQRVSTTSVQQRQC